MCPVSETFAGEGIHDSYAVPQAGQDVLPPAFCTAQTAISAFQSADEAGEKPGTGLEIGDGDEFIHGVGLVDGAGADADAGDSAAGEVGGIGEPRCAGEAGGGVGFEQRLNHRMA